MPNDKPLNRFNAFFLALLAALISLASAAAQAQPAFRSASNAALSVSPQFRSASSERYLDQPLFRAASSAASETGSLIIPLPSTFDGDVMIAAIGVRPNTATIAAPAGWTLVRRIDNAAAPANSLAVFRKATAASEPASYTWNVSGASGAVGGIQAFAFVDTANPIDVEAGQATTTSLSHPTPSITTTVARAIIVTAHTMASGTTWTPPTGMVEGFDRQTSSDFQSIEGNYVNQSAAGATEVKTATAASAGDTGNTHILALRPAPPVLNIVRPAGTVPNDVMIAAISVRSSTAAITPPAGWTLVRRIDNATAPTSSLAVFRKVAAAGEPASYSWGVSGANAATGGIQTFSNVDVANPIDVEAGQATPSSLSHATPSITTTGANAMIVTAYAMPSSTSWTPPAGMTESFERSTLGDSHSMEAAFTLQSGAGATGAKTATAASGADPGNAHILALRPGSGVLSISPPVGTAANDVLIAAVGVRPWTAAIAAPVGWTLVRRIDNPDGQSNSLAVYRKVASGAEPATYAWNTGSAAFAVGGVQAFFNVDTANPIDVESGQATPASLSHSTPSVLTTVANTMIVTAHTFQTSTTWTPPAGMAEGFDVQYLPVGAGQGQSVEGTYALQAVAGASGAKTATAAGVAGDQDPGATHILALRPFIPAPPPVPANVTGGTITYKYDPFGNLTQTNAGGVITTLTYDLRGRKVGMVDPDMGTWRYEYNALGELARQTDAKNQVTSMAYDKLGRMTQRTEPDLVSNWFYDAYQGGALCNKGIGKLCQVSATNSFARTISYDPQGRVATITTSIDTSYTIDYTYDSTGRLNTTRYPTGFEVQNVYNGFGYLSKVQRANDPGGDATVYWTANSQNAAGQVTSEQLGNTLTTTRTYDALFRMTAVQSSNAGGSAHHLAYTFDAIGNITTRIDNVQAITENFAYDSLNRLISASGPGLTTRAFSYDAIGNVTYKSDVGVYSYPLASAARPHAVSSVTNGALANSVTASSSYDANGSLVSASGTVYVASGAAAAFSRWLSYTAANMPLDIVHSNGTSVCTKTINGTARSGKFCYSYTYNADHERVRLVTTRPDDTLTSIYLHPAGKGALLYEKEIRASDGRVEHKHYVNGGSGLVGVFVTKSVYAAGDGAEMRYYHRDHLGSIAAITNPSGAVLERLSYEVFGERRNANGTPHDRTSPAFGVTTDRGYTAHEHLDELNLIHMNGRVYDPVLARFMTADPFLNGGSNLQSYNRYSYTDNNPIMYADPSGYFKLKKLFKPVEKAWKEVWHSEIGRIAVVAAVAWYAGPMIGDFLIANGPAWASAPVWGEFGIQGYALSTAGGIVAGAGTGFATGFVASGGDFQQGLKSAVGGGLLGGVDAYFGNTWSIARVGANSVAGGIASAVNGGTFEDGFRSSLRLSGLTYLNYSMRGAMIESSLKDTRLHNAAGISAGSFGDAFKLGGARAVFDELGRMLTCDSPLGGCQGGAGRMFSLSYQAGGTLDKIVEAFAGPHDFLNSGYWYDNLGNARNLRGIELAVGETLNALNVFVAAPVAGAALIPAHAYEAWRLTKP